MTSTNAPSQSDLALETFWDDFDLLPTRFARFAFKRWYVFTGGLYLFLLLTAFFPLDVLASVRYGLPLRPFPARLIATCLGNLPYYATGWDATCYILTNPGLIGWLFGVSLVVVAFNVWRRAVPHTLRALYAAGRLETNREQGDTQADFLDYLHDYRQMLTSRNRFLIIGVLFALILLLEVLEGPLGHLPQWLRYHEGRIILLDLLDYVHQVITFPVARLFGAYFGGIIGWSMYVTGHFVGLLSTRFQVNIQPSHPDRCGGLQRLGGFVLGMVVPIVIIGVFTTAYGTATALWFPDYPEQMIFAYVGTLFFAFPLAVVAFFVPLNSIHLEMVRQRDSHHNEFANRIAVVEERIYRHLDNSELEEADAALQELNILKELYPEASSFPVWPFDRGTLIKFWSPQIVTVATSVIGFVMNMEDFVGFFNTPSPS